MASHIIYIRLVNQALKYSLARVASLGDYKVELPLCLVRPAVLDRVFDYYVAVVHYSAMYLG